MRMIFLFSFCIASASAVATEPVAPPLPSSTWDTPVWQDSGTTVKTPEPPAPPSIATKAKALCAYMETCMKARPGKTALCVKMGLKDSGILDHILEGDTAKDLSRFLRKEGFQDRENGLVNFKQLPEGSILVLDAHDPVKDKRPACPKVYGNVLVKCGDKWVDDTKNDLDFHMKRGCRTKGIWLHADMKLDVPVVKTRKRLITDPDDSPATPPAGEN